jgi:uncharacterized damage-inducible protein DinB
MSTAAERKAMIARIRELPDKLAAVVAPLTDEQLTTPYAAGEWTVAQNVHHVADAHMNAYIRLKLILTEDNPPLKPYHQDVWAAMPDATPADVENSLTILRGLHARWADVFDNLNDDDWSRRGDHPENDQYSVDVILRIYSNHGEGHITQIKETLAAGGQL